MAIIVIFHDIFYIFLRCHKNKYHSGLTSPGPGNRRRYRAIAPVALQTGTVRGAVRLVDRHKRRQTLPWQLLYLAHAELFLAPATESAELCAVKRPHHWQDGSRHEE